MTSAAGVFLVICAIVLSMAGAFEIVISGARDQRRELRGMLSGAAGCLAWSAAALLAAQHVMAVLCAAAAVLILAAWWHGGGRKRTRRAARETRVQGARRHRRHGGADARPAAGPGVKSTRKRMLLVLTSVLPLSVMWLLPRPPGGGLGYTGLCLIWGALCGMLWRLPPGSAAQLFRRRGGS